ncbi:peptidase M48 [Sphingomonas metalli]|uniref:Peptidase M48 n=1 Tax=Sphingomonas metalli TaxID=1779358 RepID=A0A916WQH1_9SPHN|nr:M48 family metalloprotease [Sphingomonas metalli]GGB20124.1 peptidase M48 [Sphingomonas metalli]
MKRFVARLASALAASMLVLVQPALAQSVLRDAETESLLNDMSAPLVKAAGLNPRDVHIVLVNDDSVNAFVAGGQTVYVHSGTISAADTANEVQGVIAHEIGHIVGGHVALADRAARGPMGISLLSLLAGVAAIAAGGSEAGLGVIAAGQQAAQGSYLAFSRTQESSADAAGARFLNDSGITGRGYLSFFKKMQQLEYRYGITRKVGFLLDHPVSSERIANLSETLEEAPSWKTPSDPALEERFRRVKAKLRGYVDPPEKTLQTYPQTDQSIYAHYARAYAFHKAGYPDKAAAETGALVAAAPRDPYFLEMQGQILLESGQPRAALDPLRAATDLSRSNPLIATTLGHALIATEDKANLPEAIRVLRVATQRDDDNPWAWMQLGTAYEQTGDTARAALATAERAQMTGDPRTAVVSARYAMANIPANTADWIRAQDIAMTAGDAAAADKKKRRR